MILNPYRFGGGASGYLDGVTPAPQAVLSLKKLISTATVSIRVRRSSDNAEQDIGFTGNALDTASLATFVGANSAYVVTWYDQTGNGEHATQATAANQPRIVNAGSYLGEVEFDGSNDSLKITSLTMGTAYGAVYSKIKKASQAGTEIIFELSDNYNSYTGTAFVVYTGLNAGMQNTHVYGSTAFATLKKLTILFDCSQPVAADHTKCWLDGTTQDPPTSTLHANNAGPLGTRDFFIAARNSASLYSDQSLETVVLYNADTLASRASIEAIL